MKTARRASAGSFWQISLAGKGETEHDLFLADFIQEFLNGCLLGVRHVTGQGLAGAFLGGFQIAFLVLTLGIFGEEMRQFGKLEAPAPTRLFLRKSESNGFLEALVSSHAFLRV